MDRILVISLTRLGDLIQTGPLVSGLRRRHPGAHLGLLALEGFAAAARLLPDVDEVLSLDLDQAVGRVLDLRRPLSARAAWLRDRVRDLRGEGWDLVINLSHSRDSAVLATLLSRGEVRGIQTRPDGRVVVQHPWAQYFFCVTGNRDLNHFNLVDIYRMVGALAPEAKGRLELKTGAEALECVERLLDELPGGSGRRRPLILVQPGASRDNRRWPTERLAQAMRRLHDEAEAAFLLLGTRSESPLCAELAARATGLPLLDLSGRTSLEELAALCSRGDLLITNDTGTLHVAAARGLRSVSLFFATALPWETGPWLEGCFILQAELECSPCSHQVNCPHVMCRDLIPESCVTGAALELLRRAGWQVPIAQGWQEEAEARVWETVRGVDGLQDLRLLGRRRPGVAEIAGRVYRRLWRTQLAQPAGDESHQEIRFGDELREWLQDWGAPAPGCAGELSACESDLLEMARMAAQGLALVEQAHRELARSRPGPQELAEAIEAIPRLDDLLFRWELTHPLLRPLGVLFRFGRDELREEDSLERLGSETRRLYLDLSTRARLAAGWIREARGLLDSVSSPPIIQVPVEAGLEAV